MALALLDGPIVYLGLQGYVNVALANDSPVNGDYKILRRDGMTAIWQFIGQTWRVCDPQMTQTIVDACAAAKPPIDLLVASIEVYARISATNPDPNAQPSGSGCTCH